jgi:hypothetical protein
MMVWAAPPTEYAGHRIRWGVIGQRCEAGVGYQVFADAASTRCLLGEIEQMSIGASFADALP